MDLKLLFTITSLGLVDAINVCAIAVLTMVLITILTQNPKNIKQTLYAGLMFSLAVFIMYFVYGTIIYTFFKGVAEGIQGASPIMYNFFVILIIIVGILNIRDYFNYRAGTIGTEMPLMLRPKVKKWIHKITSPGGAFIVGLFVTLFLLPCTMMPLFVAINKLSFLGYSFFESIPWIVYYNILFILPMIILTMLVYLGFSRVEDISGWKDRNIKKLHLAAGIIMLLLGIAMIIGWV